MLKSRQTVAAAVLLTLVASLAAAEVKPETEDQKTLFALGLAMSGSLATFSLTAEEAELVAAGMKAGATDGEKHGINPAEYQTRLQEFAKSRSLAAAAEE